MAFDIAKLRTAAAQEQRDLARAEASLDAAVAKGEALAEDAPEAQLARAVAGVHKAGERIANLSDRVAIHLAPATPDEVLGALERDVPLVLLPVRLETRVVEQPAGRWQLLVRVYPDAIHADTHEPRLTAAEEQAGLEFWSRPEAERGAGWAGLVALAGPERAAWVTEATRTDPTTGVRVHAPAIAGSRFTRPAWADTLPDEFWFSVRVDGADLPLERGARIRSPVATGPDPRLIPDADDGTDAGMRWMTDFDAAVAQGLGVRIALGQAAPRLIDEVLAFGVRATRAPADGARLLGGLLDAHRYADGLEVLAVGTPSNSTTDAPAGFSSDRAARAEAAPPPGGHAIAPSADGARIASALGLDRARLAGVTGADATGEADAQAMLTLLWPGTLGYFLAQMLGESVSAEEAGELRAHAINWVRARGPLAPVRAGRNPYGVLPVTSLSRFVPDQSDTGGDRFLALLRGLAPAWRTAAAAVPKAGRGDPAHAAATLAEILALSPVSTAVDARRIYPDGVLDIITGLSGMDEQQQATVDAVQRKLTQSSMSGLGRLQEGDGLLKMVGAGDARTVTIARVQAAALSATAPLVDDYLHWLRAATPDQIAREEEKFGAPLLYLLARYALLHQYARAALTNPGRPPELEIADLLDRYVVVDIPGSLTPGKGILDVLGSATIDVTHGGTVLSLGQSVQQVAGGLAEHIAMGGGFADPLLQVHGELRPGPGPGPVRPRMVPRGLVRAPTPGGPATAAVDPGAAEAAQSLSALDHLAGLPSATLDRLLRETLDLASHRLDAWVTSLATMRLSRMRAAKAAGAHLGAYGASMRIVPATPAALEKPPGSPAATPDALSTPNQGFLPAPSLGHAATAAVLRSAHAAHGDGAPFAVTLESRRVRRAKELLDGVREGQPLGALLGYRLERSLLDAGAASAIAKLRDAAPLRTSAAPAPAGAAFEQIAPRDVADGLRIARGEFQRPALSQAEGTAVDAAVADLRDALDATGDLLLAEGVHQIVAGTPARAAVATQAAAGSGPPPDRYDVLTTPRSGTGLTQRVLLVCDSDSEDWVAARDRTPRVFADPLMEGWAASRLGGPRDYAAVVAFRDADGKQLGDPVEVVVAELGLGALDVIAMSSPAAEGQLCELERRVLDHALSREQRPAKVPVDALATIVGRSEHQATSKRVPLADLIVAAVAAGALLGSARVGAAHELDPALSFEADAYDINELSKRVAAIVGLAEPIRDALRRILDDPDEKVDLRALDVQLRAASLLVASALPEVADIEHPQARSRLVAQGHGTLAELQRRLAAADVLISRRSIGPASVEAVLQRREIVELLVDAPPPITPQLLSPVVGALGALLADPPSLGPAAKDAAARSSVLRGFLAKVRRVRPGVARLDESETIAVALGRDPIELRVAQSGTRAGAPWAGLPGAPVPGGVTSIVVAGSAGFSGSAPVAALVLDDWSEVVPREQEVSALAVHAERPDNDAPQSILVAVPPDPSRAWDVATLRAVLDETLELATMRMVDPPALGQFGHLLPALLLACTGRQAQIKVPERQFFPRVGR